MDMICAAVDPAEVGTDLSEWIGWPQSGGAEKKEFGRTVLPENRLTWI
jgi:hypothetical protein